MIRLATIAVLCLCQVAFAQEQLANPTEKNFSSGGRLEMHLGAGAYEILGTDRNKIRVTYSAGGSENEVHVSLSINGIVGKLKVDGPSNNSHVRIELPKQISVFVRLSAGEMQVKGIQGAKDVEAHAGDVEIDVGDPDNYAQIDASVGSGDLDAKAFGVQKGGLFRSFSQKRKGQFRLHAHLGAGKLRLHSVSQ